MCAITCDNDYVDEDGGTTYLTWKNGQYLPAPPMLYVPGLRAALQKQAEQARWHAAPRDFERTCALSGTYCARNASHEVQRAILSGANPHVTAQDFNRHKICDQPAPIATATSTNCSSNVDGSSSRIEARANGGAKGEGHNFLQQSHQSPGTAANTSPPESPLRKAEMFHSIHTGSHKETSNHRRRLRNQFLHPQSLDVLWLSSPLLRSRTNHDPRRCLQHQ